MVMKNVCVLELLGLRMIWRFTYVLVSNIQGQVQQGNWVWKTVEIFEQRSDIS